MITAEEAKHNVDHYLKTTGQKELMEYINNKIVEQSNYGMRSVVIKLKDFKKELESIDLADYVLNILRSYGYMVETYKIWDKETVIQIAWW